MIPNSIFPSRESRYLLLLGYTAYMDIPPTYLRQLCTAEYPQNPITYPSHISSENQPLEEPEHPCGATSD